MNCKSQTPCWLCRVIGHKWVTRRKYSVDGVSMSDTVLWGCCLRCGAPPPDRIMDATANAGSHRQEEAGQ